MKSISQLLCCALIFSIVTIYASDGKDLVTAVSSNNTESTESLPISNLNFKVAEALIDAVSKDNVGLTEILLAHKAFPDVKIEYGTTPLHIATSRGNVPTVSLLITYGAQPDLANDFGQTALHFAAMYGFPEVIKTLWKNGANINSLAAGDETPLHSAILHGQPQSVKALLECKADRTIKNSEGKTPEEIAQHSGNEEITRLLTGWASCNGNPGKSSPKL